MKTTNQIINLDCPPGHPRPGDLIGWVIEGTGLPEKNPASTFFGNWRWEYHEVKPEIWLKAKPILEKRIKALYHEGIIRYGSW